MSDAYSRFADVSAVITRPNNATLYTAGDVIGQADTSNTANAGDAILVFDFGKDWANKAIYIEAMKISTNQATVPAGMTTLRLEVYKDAPAAILDNAAWARAIADVGKWQCSISSGTMLASGGSVCNEVSSLNKRVTLDSEGKLRGVLVTEGGFTPTASAVKTITLRCVQA